MEPVNKHFFIQNNSGKLSENPSLFIQYFSMFSSITPENLYVWDILQSRFYYIQPNNLLLGSFSVEDAMREGCDFYLKIVYADDLPLCREMWKTILQYLKNFKEKREEIDYFSCTFRLQRIYSFLSQRPLLQMVYHRIKPVWDKDELRYFICVIRSSTVKEPGNLCCYNKENFLFEEYNFIAKRWKQKQKIVFTEREKAILMLAGQGKNSGEIANDLCRGQNTIRNQIKSLFSKLNVHSMQEAIESVYNQHLVSLKQEV